MGFFYRVDRAREGNLKLIMGEAFISDLYYLRVPLKDFPCALLMVMEKKTHTGNCVRMNPGMGKLSLPRWYGIRGRASRLSA